MYYDYDDSELDGLSVDEACEVSETILESCEENDRLNSGSKKELTEYEMLVNKNDGSHNKAMFEYCFIHNFPYVSDIYKTLIKNGDADIYKKMPDIYVDTINADFRYQDVTFFSQIRQENFEKIYSQSEKDNSLSDDDRKNRQIVIDVFSYDPFATEAEADKPQLYRDLAGMSSEAMRKDVAKQKAAISIVRSYGNIEKYQRKVNEITSTDDITEDTQKLLDQYLTLISKIQSNINQTAEKNNFTVKGIGSNGRGMLSDVLNQISEKGIDEGITNFYDIATSKSIEEIANISMKAQLNQVNLSKTDYVDILNEQCQMVREAQQKARKAEEALRLAKEKITKQELIEELAIDYKNKGISEEEIQEFIKREYKMYDGEDD